MSKDKKLANILFVIDVVSFLIGILWNNYFSNAYITYIIWTVATVIAIYISYLKFGKKGFLGAIVMCGILIAITYPYSVKNETNHRVNNNIKGDLYINLNKINFEYGDKYISEKITFNKEDINKVNLTNYDKKIAIHSYLIKNNTIIIKNISNGDYDLSLSIAGYPEYNDSISFLKKDLVNGKWKENIFIRANVQYEEFNIFVNDSENSLIRNAQCALKINNKEINNLKTDSTGKIPYTFTAPIDTDVNVTLNYEGKKYSNNFIIVENEKYYNVKFDTPKKENNEKIVASEKHTPDDAATNVSIVNWNSNDDIGIDGKKYVGGLKCIISNMFISLGSNGSEKIVSRVTIPVDKNDNNPYFVGSFILDQSMFGSKSHANINMIVNGQSVFSTIITDENKNAIPFNVNFSGSDTIIIETTAYLEGTDFVFGIVSNS